MKHLLDRIAAVEQQPRLPQGDGERHSGYGVMGLPFSSGYVLALRRFTASSIGPAYTSVWLRRPTGAWLMYTNVDASLSCPRYFGSALEANEVRPIDISWHDDRHVTVRIGDDVDLTWDMRLHSTLLTRLMSAFASALPERAWRNGAFLKAMGRFAGRVLHAGRLGLTGDVPNRQHFRAIPRRMWFVAESRAVLKGEDFGSPAPLPVQARLGDFWIPQRGIFVLGSTAFDAWDRGRHIAPEVRAP